MTLLLVGAELGDHDAGYGRLIGLARERLSKPWQSAALDAAAVKGALGEEKAHRTQNALILSDQIGPILATGSHGNPRQIKRFLNTLLLRQLTADARGFGDSVKLPVLAKLMLAERFLPRLFDQIAEAAAVHKGGLCDELAVLEDASRERQTPAPPASPDREQVRAAPRLDAAMEAAKPKATARATDDATTRLELTKPTESALMAEWLSAKSILAWARVEPLLASIDLRPYLFVTKDRRDYFGATSALGHLAAVVDQLLGPRLTVHVLAPDLKRLVPAEAAQVFEALRSRIVGADDLGTEPAGAAGLAVLVKSHPSLQSDLLDLLQGLPRDRVGPWLVAGWGTVITDSAVSSRFDRLLEEFASDASNRMLKAAAAAALRTRRSGR